MLRLFLRRKGGKFLNYSKYLNDLSAYRTFGGSLNIEVTLCN